MSVRTIAPQRRTPEALRAGNSGPGAGLDDSWAGAENTPALAFGPRGTIAARTLHVVPFYIRAKPPTPQAPETGFAVRLPRARARESVSNLAPARRRRLCEAQCHCGVGTLAEAAMPKIRPHPSSPPSTASSRRRRRLSPHPLSRSPSRAARPPQLRSSASCARAESESNSSSSTPLKAPASAVRRPRLALRHAPRDNELLFASAKTSPRLLRASRPLAAVQEKQENAKCR